MRRRFTQSRRPTVLGEIRARSWPLAIVILSSFGLSSLSPALSWAQPVERPTSESLAPTEIRRSNEVVAGTADAMAGAVGSVVGSQSKSEPISRDGVDEFRQINPDAVNGTLQGSEPATFPPSSETRALPTAANKSGVTSTAISVPQGSGKIDGMGESFSTQVSTGTATFTVPFAIPAARGGVSVSLALSYSSSRGLGVAGLGWDVGVPQIARQTDHGLPGYDDRADFHPNQDRFVFNGGQELAPICTVTEARTCKGALPNEVMPPWSAGSMYFRPRVEGSFQRFFWSADRRTWRVQDKSGVTLEFGVPLDGSNRVDALELNPDKACNINDPNPARGCEIYRWHLVRQYDTYGVANPSSPTALPAPNNVVVYRYRQDGGVAYLSDIFHTTPASAPKTTDLSRYAHHVRLTYSDRSDPTFSYRSGWRMDRRWRLEGVDVASKAFNEGEGARRHMSRRYHLEYDGRFHASMLQRVRVEGRCAAPGADPNVSVFEQQAQTEDEFGALPEKTGCPELPAMTFEYGHVAPLTTRGTPGSALPGYEGFDERIRQLAVSPRHSLDDALTDLFDVNSDALPDVLITAPGVYGPDHGVFFNSPAGVLDSFGSARQMAVQGVLGADANTLELANQNVVALDVDGDATINLLHMPMSKKYALYTPRLLDQVWTWVGTEVTTASGQNTKIDFGTDAFETKVVDVNFDGLVDVVVSTGTEFQTFFSLGRYAGGNGQFGSARWSEASSAEVQTDPVRTCVPWSSSPVRFSDKDIRLGDMNGDGITDIVRLRRGDVQYWPGRGNGVWGTGSRDDCPPNTFPDKRYIQMDSSPVYSDIEATTLRTDDVNGDGLDDLVQVRADAIDIWLNVDGTGWTERHIVDDTPASPSFASRVRLVDVNGSGTRDILWGESKQYRYVDLQGGARPGLLTRIKNGLGKSTTIEYSTSTAEMLAAERHGGACDPGREPWSSPWCSKMPIVAHVVKRVTESDNLVVAGKPPCTYVTEYSYRDAVYDGRQREFRGFRMVRTKRIGDENSPTDFIESTFLLGECKDETANGRNECADSSEDNPREALKGLPILTERYDEQGVYLSSEATTYRLRRLYIGLDGREVRHAFESAQRSYLYDTELGRAVADPEADPFSSVDLELECAAFDPETDDPLLVPGTVDTGDEMAAVPVRQPAGRAEIASTSIVDCFGNHVVAIALGCVEGDACPTEQVGMLPDETILNYTLSEQLADAHTGWLWRTVETYLTGSAHPGVLRNRNFRTYDEFGAPKRVEAGLAGTLELERPNPPVESSSDDTIFISEIEEYDAFGNPTRQTGANGRCGDLAYDEAYASLATSETVYTGGCGVGSLSTGAAYDRGLARVTSVVNVQLQATRVEFDGFGRLAALTHPHPTEAGDPSPLPSVRFEYFLPPSLGTAHSVIHISTQDGAGLADNEYLERFSYVDGFGRTVVTLAEADPQAGDGGDWIASEFQEYDNKNAVRRKYLGSFYSGEPTAFPIGTAPSASYGRQRYDAFGRQLQTFDLDGTVTLQSGYHALTTDLFDASDLEPGPHQNTPASTRNDGHGRSIVATERIHVNGVIEARDIRTQFLPTGEPEIMTRVRVGQPDAQVVRWIRYDSLGRMVLNVEPHTTVNFTDDKNAPASGLQAWRYAYNDAGDLVGTEDARGCGVNFSYDTAGRLLTEDYSPCEAHHPDYTVPDLATASGPSGVEVLYFYDSAPPEPFPGLTRPPGLAVLNDDYFRGRLVATWDRASANWTSYDGRGRVIQNARQLMKPVAEPPEQTQVVSERYAPTWYYRDIVFDAADRAIAASTGSEVDDLRGTAIAPGSGLPASALFTASAARRTSVVTTTYTHRGTVGGAGGSYATLLTSVARTADGLVNRIEYGDAAGTTTSFAFDNRRRLASRQTYRGALGGWPAEGTTSFQLLLQDEDFKYDSVGNPIEISDFRNAAEWPAGAKPVTQKLQYDDLHRVTRVDLRYSGGDDSWTSPFAPELAASSDPRRAAPSPHVAFAARTLWQTFQYDWLGNTSKTDDDAHGFYDRSLGTISNGVAEGKPYQLENATSLAGASSGRDGSVAAVYDSAGNLTRMNLVRSLTPASLCLPVSGQCSQRFAYDWDEVGRLSRAQRWDGVVSNSPADTLPQATPAANVLHHYDANDDRVLKTAIDGPSAAHTVYVFDSLELRRAEFTGEDYVRSDQTEVPYLLANSVRLARLVFEEPLDGEPRVGGAALHVFFELGDHLGSTSVVLDKATGELVERGTYQAYGGAESDYRPERWKGFREDYRFTGKEEDIEVGLHYFGRRFYNPLLNRWISPDPLAVHSLGEADANLYAYVRGRALMAIDPLGLEEFASQEDYAKFAEQNSIEVKSHDEMGNQGHWLKSDRKNNTAVWDQANRTNLAKQTGYSQYKTIAQRAAFYGWFSNFATSQGHEIKWAAAAAEASGEIDTLHSMAMWVAMPPPHPLAVPDGAGSEAAMEIRDFAKDGNKAIFNDVFGKLRALTAGSALTGDAAARWDANVLAQEQALMQPIYNRLSGEARGLLGAGAQQKTFSSWFARTFHISSLPALKGDIMSAKDRWSLGMTAMGLDRKVTAMPDVPSRYKDGSRLQQVMSLPP